MPAKEVLTFDVADYTDPPTAHSDFGTIFCCAFRDSLPPASVCDSLENRLSLMPSQDIYVLITMLDGHFVARRNGPLDPAGRLFADELSASLQPAAVERACA